MATKGRKPGGKNSVKNASKIIKHNNSKKETFNKNHQDELNKSKGEQIKTGQDGKDTFGI